MFVNPKHAIEQGLIRGIRDEAKQVQPNAIDFDINQLFSPTTDRPFVLNGDDKQHQKFAEQIAVDHLGQGLMFTLAPGQYYDFSSSVHVKLPAGICALLIVRSTLNRNGIFLTSGLYDSGFEGTVAGTLHNRSCNPAFIAPNSMIGQLMLFRAEYSGVLYAGGYNTAVGEHWIK